MSAAAAPALRLLRRVWQQAAPVIEPRLEWLCGDALRLRRDVLAFYRRCEQQGGFVRTNVWRLPLCVITAPELIEEVLVRKQRCFIKSGALRSTKRAFGQGLLTSDRELWRRQRRTIQPAFHSSRIERYCALMSAATRRLVGSFRDGEVRNIHHDMTELCFDVLAQSLFGEEDMSAARALVADTAAALHEFHHLHAQWIGAFGGLAFAGVRAVSTALGRPDFVADPTLLPTSYGRRFRDAVAALDRFVAGLIARRRAAGTRQAEHADADGDGDGDGEDFLSMLLAARDDTGAPLPDGQIRDEVVTMFLAGHETAASSLTWALYLLARHPEVARRLGAELDAGDGVSLLFQVIREGLRLYPPAYRISRTAVESCQIGGFDVKVGTELVIPQWAVHRSARFFPEPDAFRPERWTPELTARLPKFAYFPFGGGPRTCIGNTFAEVEASVVLGNLCRSIELRMPAGASAEVTPFLGVTLLPPGNTLMLEVRRRKPERATVSTRAPENDVPRPSLGCPVTSHGLATHLPRGGRRRAS